MSANEQNGPLQNRHCESCNKETPPLSADECRALLPELSESWELVAPRQALVREFTFQNYYQTIAFVNALAWIAHSEDHHPNLEVSYNRCRVRYSTHVINGLSQNDFICAAKIDALS